MIEQSGLTPMAIGEVCSEAGRYAVYCRVLEEKASAVGFPFRNHDGFIEVFSLCFALLFTNYHNETLMDRIPMIGIRCFDKGSVKDENDVLYVFPRDENDPDAHLLDMALLYVAFEFGLSKGEPDLGHLPFLFSIKEEIRPYVEAGYYLKPGSEEVEKEVREDVQRRLPLDLLPSLENLQTQFDEMRAYLEKVDP